MTRRQLAALRDALVADLPDVVRQALLPLQQEMQRMSATTSQAEADMTAAIGNLGTVVTTGFAAIQSQMQSLLAEAQAGGGVPAATVESYVASIGSITASAQAEFAALGTIGATGTVTQPGT